MLLPLFLKESGVSAEFDVLCGRGTYQYNLHARKSEADVEEDGLLGWLFPVNHESSGSFE